MNITPMNDKVIIVQVIYNSRRFIKPVFEAIAAQTYKNCETIAVIAGNDDGSREFLAKNFPWVKIIDPSYNIGFAKGHNLIFSAKGESASGGEADFYQLVNPDMIMQQNYIEEMLKAFQDKKVGAATGKLYKISNSKFQIPNAEEKLKLKILDTTGVFINKSGRARDRGQHELDMGQYDNQISLQAVSAAGAMYRASALQSTACKFEGKKEYFDEDFHSYWEDVDLAWRMSNAGWKCVFVPAAIGFHGRGAGSSKGGYIRFLDFVRFHRALNPQIRQLNYQNHIFMYIKNSRWFYPQFFAREFFMFFYILIFEIQTLKILPQMFNLFPKMFKKRKLVKSLAAPEF